VNKLGHLLALEREREPRARVREVAPQIRVDARPRPHERQQLEQRQLEHVGVAIER
jgi:hypothetical protein